MSRETGTDFWSRRKASVQAEAEAERREAEARAMAEAQAAIEASEAPASDAELLEAAGLKDPDALEPGDDFGAYLRAALPGHLKRRALRRLWLSNPALANLDGLLDHGEDFTDAATVVPGMATAYQVGKGMMRHVSALAEAAQGPRAANDEAEEPPAPDAEDEAVAIAAAPADAPEDPASDADAEAEAPPRRHMRFAFASPEARP